MWGEAKQQELDELSRREARQTLTAVEQHRLDALLQQVDQEEWVTLSPTIQRLREEQGELAAALDMAQGHNADLAAVAARYAALLDHARNRVSELNRRA
jgi:hypothetical protein